MKTRRSAQTSSFTIIKGTLIEETYRAFQNWDFSLSQKDNLTRIKETNSIGASTDNWLRDVIFVLSRRFESDQRDRTLIELARHECSREIWKPLLLWHMTRDEFLVRDFFLNWLFLQYIDGAYRIRVEDLYPYLEALPSQGVTLTEKWTDSTINRVAGALLRMAVHFDLMTGKATKEFISYHLPEESLLYILHAMVEKESNARRIVESPDWRLYLMAPEDVEQELFRLHQYRKLEYEVAGSLAQLKLPCRNLNEYTQTLIS